MPNQAPIDLDKPMTPVECAAWLGLKNAAELMRQKRIPRMKIGHKTVRYHPRTVLEHFKPKVRK